MTNVRATFENDVITFQWDPPAINTNTITSYNVEVRLEGEIVYSRMTSETSHTATRDDIQDEGDVVRTENTQYTVLIVASNVRGSSDSVEQTFTISAGEDTPAIIINTHHHSLSLSLSFSLSVSISLFLSLSLSPSLLFSLSLSTESAAPPGCKYCCVM